MFSPNGVQRGIIFWRYLTSKMLLVASVAQCGEASMQLGMVTDEHECRVLLSTLDGGYVLACLAHVLDCMYRCSGRVQSHCLHALHRLIIWKIMYDACCIIADRPHFQRIIDGAFGYGGGRPLDNNVFSKLVNAYFKCMDEAGFEKHELFPSESSRRWLRPARPRFAGRAKLVREQDLLPPGVAAPSALVVPMPQFGHDLAHIWRYLGLDV
jgi:hypothetical protein